jgi:site-specific DNA recombinase
VLVKGKENMIKHNKKEEKKRYVIYTRCSTDDQAQGDFTTLDAQAYHCKNMLDAFGYELANLGTKGIIKDDGYSGKDLKRPGIQMILSDINKKRSFDGIIFFRLDRLTRNPRDLYSLIDLLRDKNIDFVSVRENLDSSTAIGRVVIGILGLLSAFERELTGERVKASCIARVRQGKWVGGNLPYGYKLIDDGDPLPNGRQPRKIVINPEIGPKIRIIWEMAADNKSLYAIAHELTRREIKTPHGKEWRKQSIDWILKNPFYKGYIKYSDEINKGNHPALLDEQLWEKANKTMSAKMPGHRFVKRPQGYIYLLAGLLKCGKCASHYVCESGNGHSNAFYYYICGRAKQKLGCGAPRLSAKGFDNALIDYFKRASEDQEIIVKAIGEAVLDAQVNLEHLEKLITPLQEKLANARENANKLLDLAMNNKVAQGKTYKCKMAKLDNEIFVLEDELEKLLAKKNVAKMAAYSGEFLHSNLKLAMQYIEQAPPDAQKALIRALIKEIIIYEDRIEIKMYIDQPTVDSLSCNLPAPEAQKTTKNEERPTDLPANMAETCRALVPTAPVALCSPERQSWLPRLDSNQEQMIQNHPCYHYTTGQ